MENEQSKKIIVLIKEPYKEPYVKEIENTLKAKQEIVDGYIECVSLPKIKGVDVFVNEEGKLQNLEGNFWLPHYDDCVVGTCFMVGYDNRNGDSKSLTDKQIKFCKEYIKNFEIPIGLDLYEDFNILKPYMMQQQKVFDRKLKSIAEM